MYSSGVEPAVADDELRIYASGISINKRIIPTASEEKANLKPLFQKNEFESFLKNPFVSGKRAFLFLILLREQK